MPQPHIDSNHGYLPPGLHEADTAAMRDLYVDRTPIQAHRQQLFSGYLRLVEAIAMTQVHTEQWIGGSFLSNKPAPSDIDLVNFCDIEAMEALSGEVLALVSQYFNGKETAKHCHCDSYCAPMAPENHPSRELFEIMATYWQNRLGKDIHDRPKGMLKITLETQPTADEETEDDAAT